MDFLPAVLAAGDFVGVPCLRGSETSVAFSSGVGNVSSGKVALHEMWVLNEEFQSSRMTGCG
jgi:hypothetical protein